MLKRLLREKYQGLVDVLIDRTYSYYEEVLKNLPDTMTEEQKLDTIQQFLDQQLNTIKSQLNTVDLKGMLKK